MKVVIINDIETNKPIAIARVIDVEPKEYLRIEKECKKNVADKKEIGDALNEVIFEQGNLIENLQKEIAILKGEETEEGE